MTSGLNLRASEIKDNPSLTLPTISNSGVSIRLTASITSGLSSANSTLGEFKGFDLGFASQGTNRLLLTFPPPNGGSLHNRH
jgi:hypothetical protein